MESLRISLSLLLSTLLFIRFAAGQCPWQREVPDLQTTCLCAYNLGQELSVQCDQVDFPTLVDALDKYARTTPLDLLYVNNSTIEKIDAGVFENLRLFNVQLSSCKIRRIDDLAFRGQENILKNLNLQDNLLDDVPIRALKILNILNLLDLSKNRINTIPNDAFNGLTKLSTLKLSDNNVTLAPFAFRGLETSLKNLNLKGTKQKRVPEAVRGLKTLAFLDLSQNGIRELPGVGGMRTFEGLESLTALNLERNLIQNLGETAFSGIRKTLSSLSLLNNLLAEFPVGAIHSLRELRVLDIGFNLLTALPETAFRGNPAVTLLALDGNPLPTVPEKALLHLNRTLRGLSLGGRFLHCDCKLRWVAEWIRNGDLQVTSRERNPQFCGSPSRFHDRGFYSIQPDELTCPDAEVSLEGPVGVVDSLLPRTTTTARPTTFLTTLSPSSAGASANSTNTISSSTTALTTLSPTTSPSTSPTPPSSSPSSQETAPPSSTTTTDSTTTLTTTTQSTTKQSTSTQTSTSTTKASVTKNWRNNNNSPSHKQRPPLVLGYPPQRGTQIDDSKEVQVKNAFSSRQDSSVIIQWDSDTANILGFRVVYRLFGDKNFKQGPPLEASEREFKIKNVPPAECIIVCVVSLEEINVSPDTVPYQQCREVRTVASPASNMDKITIAASAAICGTIIVAVIVFIAASRRRSKQMQSLSQQKGTLPIAGLPVNCCGPTPSPNGPLGSLATLSAFNSHKDWDQVSVYSGRSIPRPRIYPMENQAIPDDLRSHVSHFSAVGGKVGKARSIADGQSHHSFSNNSHRGYLGSAFPSNLVNSRPELRQSRQSLAAASERMSRASYAGSIVHGGPAHSIASSTRRTRPRSRSRDQLNGTHIHTHQHRPGSRYSTAGSTHTLNNYCDTSDNWTDHDMDIYMARNATARNGNGGGMVPL
ncbi:vasorin isoform X2 [Uranotaenia lowii]|uniref:vasorin isoform X2 n=1 Tax=Uranotaenia lowii TaxID=190385 RepID=UPI00247A4F9F|nr:vasorin isoform X2 [Uranotaenia lowii]